MSSFTFLEYFNGGGEEEKPLLEPVFLYEAGLIEDCLIEEPPAIFDLFPYKEGIGEIELEKIAISFKTMSDLKKQSDNLVLPAAK